MLRSARKKSRGTASDGRAEAHSQGFGARCKEHPGKLMSKLTPKQEMFAKEYLIDLNATRAAIRAGYSKRTAKPQGLRLLTYVDVANLIQKGREAKLDTKANDVIRTCQDRVC